MINGVVRKDLKVYEDERGRLFELFRIGDPELIQPAMAYMSFTNPGVVRGPHEHKEQTDMFIFPGIGSFWVYLWDRREDTFSKRELEVLAFRDREPALLIVPPGVVHGYRADKITGGWALNFPDKPYKGEDGKQEVDEIRHEDDPNSPYKIPRIY